MTFLETAKLITQYARRGDPIKDAVEKSDFLEGELLYEFARYYVKGHMKK